ncbi:MAG: amidohydrolase family protein [Chitinophagaceae bacterium]
MGFKKLRADQLFDGHKMWDDQHVLIMTEEGIVEGIVPLDEAGDDIYFYNGIISPGFVNCHCHLELSHMRGLIPEKTGLVDFVLQVVKDRHFSEEIILEAIAKAEEEMLANGIVAVGDICNNTLTIPQKTKGRIWYHNFIEASGFIPSMAEIRFQQAVTIFKEYAKQYSIPVEANSIVPHAPYSVSDELWQKIIHFPGNHLMTIHNQESVSENEWFMDKKGKFMDLYKAMNMDASFFQSSSKSSLQTYLPKFLPNQPVILVHNVHTSEEDVLFAKNNGGEFYWCLCPNANLYIDGQLPDVKTFIDNKCNIVLGTDSLASNHQLSILSEMKTIQERYPFIATEQLLNWATFQGAKALQMDNIVGSLKKAESPGIILISKNLSSLERLM